jgi:hypothetical protein
MIAVQSHDTIPAPFSSRDARNQLGHAEAEDDAKFEHFPAAALLKQLSDIEEVAFAACTRLAAVPSLYA